MSHHGVIRERRAGLAIEALTAEIQGEVVLPFHRDYDRARRVFNGAIDRTPHAIICPRDVTDVIAAISYARDNDLALAVRGGGHHVGGWSVIDGGVTIDMSLMREVYVDQARRVVRVRGGALWGDVDRATQQHGLAIPGGTVASVGVGGFTLGGGIGRLSNAFGLAADNLVAVEMVTSHGAVVRASASENESLFWALRGGGGKLGVVTSLEFLAHAVPAQVWGGGMGYRIEDAPRALRVMRDLMRTASRELNLSAVIVRKDDRPFLVINAFWCGEPDAGHAAVSPLRSIATAVMDSYAPTTYIALQSVDVPGGRRGWETSAFLEELSDASIDALVAYATDASIAAPRIALLSVGGAIADVPPAETAFGGRGAEWLVQAGASWEDAADDAAVRAWASQVHLAVAGDATGVGYINMLADGRAAHSSWTMARLRAVRGEWDRAGMWV
jgi:hypothetical protein